MGGFDWLWSQYHEIELKNLLETFDAVIALASGTQKYCDDFADAAEQLGHDILSIAVKPLAEWESYLATIRRNIREHINPPVALSSGRLTHVLTQCNHTHVSMHFV